MHEDSGLRGAGCKVTLSVLHETLLAAERLAAEGISTKSFSGFRA